MIGVTASLAGLGLGLLFAKGTAQLFEAVGLGIPTGGLELAPRTIAISLLIGIGVTQLAAISACAPRHPRAADRRAAAQRPGVPASTGAGRRGSRRSSRCSASALLVAGLFGSGPASSRLSTMALGVVLLFVGVALSARWFVRPLAGAVGWPLERLFAEPGLLARENAMRNPARTATTAAALMVGLGLVVFVAVFANGIKASFDATVSRVVKADLIVRSDTMQPIPAAAADAVAADPRGRVVVERAARPGEGERQEVEPMTDVMNGVDPSTIESALQDRLGRLERTPVLGELRGNNVLIEEQFAKAHDLGVGDSYRIETPTAARRVCT